MACVCAECGELTYDCDSDLCRKCLLKWCFETDVEKNLFLGGRFYGEKLEKVKDE